MDESLGVSDNEDTESTSNHSEGEAGGSTTPIHTPGTFRVTYKCQFSERRSTQSTDPLPLTQATAQAPTAQTTPVQIVPRHANKLKTISLRTILEEKRLST